MLEYLTVWLENRKDRFHFVVSMAKSILRLLAGGFLIAQLFVSAGVLFILAEVLGIVEEL
jgi:hypothetical protein